MKAAKNWKKQKQKSEEGILGGGRGLGLRLSPGPRLLETQAGVWGLWAAPAAPAQPFTHRIRNQSALNKGSAQF